MNNVDFENRKRNRRRKKTRNYKKQRVILSIIIIILIIAILILRHISNKNNQETQNKITNAEIVNEDKNNDLIKKIDELKKLYNNKKADLVKRVDEYLNTNNLSKNNIAIVYKSIEKDDEFYLNKDMNIPLRNMKDFIIFMILEDLSRQSNIDLPDFSLEKEDINRFIKIIEENQSKKWYEVANNFYQVNISDKNIIKSSDFTKLLLNLVKKDNNNYIYQNTINFIIKLANDTEHLSFMNSRNFLGYMGHSEYKYNCEFGIIFGQNSYIYIIYTPYSEVKSRIDLRHIINNWVKDYSIN